MDDSQVIQQIKKSFVATDMETTVDERGNITDIGNVTVEYGYGHPANMKDLKLPRDRDEQGNFINAAKVVELQERIKGRKPLTKLAKNQRKIDRQARKYNRLKRQHRF